MAGSVPRTVAILNKTRSHKERWRILADGMGWCHEPEGSPVRLFRVARGMLRKNSWAKEYHYASEMSLIVALEENEAPLLIKKNLRDWLVANGYSAWLQSKNFYFL